MGNGSKTNQTEETKNIHQSLFKNWYMIFAIILAVTSLLFYLSNINHWVEWEYLKDNENSFVAGLGTLGDYFGGVLNPLLTFITIILLIRSIELQRADFKEQLREQKEQKEEFRRQAIAQEDQTWELRKQNSNQIKQQSIELFERNFFSLLNQHNDLLQQQSFDKEVDNLYSELTVRDNGYSIHYFDLNNIEKIFNHSSYNAINTYLRFLYRFLKFLSEKENLKSLDIEVHDYADILRSLISEKLLHIIAINGLRSPSSMSNFEKYRRLLEKFHFLEHMNLSIFETIDSGYCYKNINQFPSLKKEIKPLLDYNTYITNQESVAEPQLNLDLKTMRLLKIYIQYKPEAFDQNPYYIYKILPVLEFLVKNNKLPKNLLEWTIIEDSTTSTLSPIF